MEAIETIQYKGYEIKIYQDEGPEDPREWDNLGTMLCKHPRYDLGDVKESKAMDQEEIKEFIKRKDIQGIREKENVKGISRKSI